MEGSANERLDFGKMGYGYVSCPFFFMFSHVDLFVFLFADASITGEDVRLELLVATRFSIVAIVTTKLR